MRRTVLLLHAPQALLCCSQCCSLDTMHDCYSMVMVAGQSYTRQCATKHCTCWHGLFSASGSCRCCSNHLVLAVQRQANKAACEQADLNPGSQNLELTKSCTYSVRELCTPTIPSRTKLPALTMHTGGLETVQRAYYAQSR